MKRIILCLLAIAGIWALPACNADARYKDPNTGKALNLEKDPETGLMVDKNTGKPVTLYVDTQKGDTIYGKTGKVVNGHVRKRDDGTYTYIDVDTRESSADDGENKVKRTEDEYKIKQGDYKKEVEKDGDITIKDGNTKVKIDGETGERKVKKDD
jgi:hypothetical protein